MLLSYLVLRNEISLSSSHIPGELPSFYKYDKDHNRITISEESYNLISKNQKMVDLVLSWVFVLITIGLFIIQYVVPFSPGFQFIRDGITYASYIQLSFLGYIAFSYTIIKLQ